MEPGNNGSWNEFLNNSVKIIYDDGGNFPKKKEGIFKSVNDTHIFLQINSHTEAILKTKILRFEGGF